MDRRWLYGGLAVAGGVGLARPVRLGPRIAPGVTRLALIGGTFAQGLSLPLRALAREQKVAFEAILPPAPDVGRPRTEDWATRPELVRALRAFRPTLVVVALDVGAPDGAGKARQAAALRGLLLAVRALGAPVVWVGPPTAPRAGRTPSRAPSATYYPTATALRLPRGPDGLQPTVAGYAGWAGAVWQWLS